MTTDIWNVFDTIKQTLDDSSPELSNDEITKLKIVTQKNNRLLCYDCNEDSLIYDEGIIVCEKCGINNGDMIDHQQEWRFYGSEDTKHSSDPTRCGMPINPLLPESSLGTIILGRGYEKFRKLNNWNSMSYKERSLLKVFKHIQSKSDDSDISVCIIDRAKIMYKTLSEDSIKRGKSRKGLIAACVYHSCKDKNDSRTTREISQIFGLKIKKMTSGCKQFNEMMYLNNCDYIANIKSNSPKISIKRYSSLLKLTEQNRDRAIHVSKMASKLGLVSENTPSSIAVGSIYLVSQYYNLKITKKILAQLCDISEVTISKTYKKMQKFNKYLVPSDD